MATPAEMIEFLLTREYPDQKDLKHRVQVARRLGIPDAADEERRIKVAAYDAELRALSPERLESMYQKEYALHEAERVQRLAELRDKAAREEEARFFHQPYANADYVHWSKAAHWTLDEAVALSLGKAPEVVKWETVKDYSPASPFAFRYHQIRDLALRAKQRNLLQDPEVPGNFLAWLRSVDIAFPLKLEEQLTLRGYSAIDWKTLHDQVANEHEEHVARVGQVSEETDATIADLKRQIEELQVERDALAANLESLRGCAGAPGSVDKPLMTKERNTLLTLIVGMAIACYKYDPTSSRSGVPKAIADDLAQVGLSMSNDTVRKWLNLAAEFAPRTTFDDAGD